MDFLNQWTKNLNTASPTSRYNFYIHKIEFRNKDLNTQVCKL